MLEKWMTQLTKELNMREEIAVAKDRHYFLPFEPNIEVEAIDLEKKCLLKSLITERPKQNGEVFLLKAMEANLFGIGTRGAVIGLNDEGKMLTLSLELEYNSSYKDFKEKLEDFISVIDFWRKEALEHQ